MFDCFLNILNECDIPYILYNSGNKKMGLYYKYKDKYYPIDIFFTIPELYATALLGYTGGRKFNIEMRKLAKTKGYTLTSNGIYTLKNDEKDILVEVSTEKDIFTLLGLKYIPPDQRTL
jgi:DNA polymerase/3'-5' exonuclease PolX